MWFDEVNNVLKEIGADEVPQIRVFNKIDLVEGEIPRTETDVDGNVHSVWLSAKAAEGLDQLIDSIQAFFHLEHKVIELELGPADGRLHALMHRSAQILSESLTDNGGWHITVKMQNRIFQQLLKNDTDFSHFIEMRQNNH